ncbi:MAG: hypothetical protein ABIA04_11010 [Pseudomonadota bacterium]
MNKKILFIVLLISLLISTLCFPHATKYKENLKFSSLVNDAIEIVYAECTLINKDTQDGPRFAYYNFNVIESLKGDLESNDSFTLKIIYIGISAKDSLPDFQLGQKYHLFLKKKQKINDGYPYLLAGGFNRGVIKSLESSAAAYLKASAKYSAFSKEDLESVSILNELYKEGISSRNLKDLIRKLND